MSKRILSMLIAVIILLSSLSMITLAASSGKCGDKVEWTLSDNGKLTISGTGAMSDYGYKSGEYSPWFDVRNNIKEIEVKNGVTAIGEYAFYQCAMLREVSIADSVTEVKKDAFKGCAMLESYTVPKNVTEISRHLFHDCISLKKVVIHTGVKTIHTNAFENCTGLKEIIYKGNADEWKKVKLSYANETEQKMLYCTGFEIEGDNHKHTFSDYRTDKATNTKTAKCDVDYCYRCDIEKIQFACPHFFLYYRFNNDDGYYKNGTETSYCYLTCGASKTRERENSMLVDSTKEFNDVPAGAWYKEYVDFAVGRAMFTGTGNKKFEPLSSITRSMFVTVLARIGGCDYKNNVDSGFSDVPKNKWYTGAVKWAFEKGITNGTSKTTFAPDKAITRQEICAMMVRFSDRLGKVIEPEVAAMTFKDDSKIASWAKKDVYICQNGGLVGGDNYGYFKPTNTATRAEVAKILTMYWKYNLVVTYDHMTDDEIADF